MAESFRGRDDAPRPQAVRLAQARCAARLRLKAWGAVEEQALQPARLAGRDLPACVGETTGDTVRVLCIGPCEWLIVSRDLSALEIRRQIEPDLAGRGLVLADLTEGLAAIEVGGSAVSELLSKGCGLDFHARSFPAGRCARTRFAQIGVLVERLEDEGRSPRFELTVGRSHLRYLVAWLEDAALEFGVT